MSTYWDGGSDRQSSLVKTGALTKTFLLQTILPEKSSVLLSQTKVEIKLRKEDIGSWPSLELKKPKD